PAQALHQIAHFLLKMASGSAQCCEKVIARNARRCSQIRQDYRGDRLVVVSAWLEVIDEVDADEPSKRPPTVCGRNDRGESFRVCPVAARSGARQCPDLPWRRRS